MPDITSCGVETKRVLNRAIVNLKVAKKDIASASRQLGLAEKLSRKVGDVTSLWLGPDIWLLISDNQEAASIVKKCETTLQGMLLNAVDYSSGLAVFRIGGTNASQLLASGTGLDLRTTAFPPGSCSRTRLAQVAVVVVATGNEEFELYIDRSYERYFQSWIDDNVTAFF